MEDSKHRKNKGSQTITSAVTSETQRDNHVKDKGIETDYTYDPDENVVRREVQELKMQMYDYTQEEKNCKDNIGKLKEHVMEQTKKYDENGKKIEKKLTDLQKQGKKSDQNGDAIVKKLDQVVDSLQKMNQTTRPLPPISPPSQNQEQLVVRNIVGWNVLFALKILIMISAIMLISSSSHISNVKPCELKTALDYIKLEINPHPCKHNSMKEFDNEMLIAGIINFLIHWILFYSLLFIFMFHRTELKLKLFYCLILIMAILAFSFCIVMGYLYIDVGYKEGQETSFDFLQLESSMLTWLEKHYTSDNTSYGEAVSIQWNIFFIRYDCCGVSEVIGTTNDFDNTPWCTTSGSCQATASQIPKTCCKSVSLADYGTAPGDCHASVNGGTYKPSCISRMKALSRDNINESQLAMLSLSLVTLGILQGTEFFLFVALFIIMMKRRSNRTDVEDFNIF